MWKISFTREARVATGENGVRENEEGLGMREDGEWAQAGQLKPAVADVFGSGGLWGFESTQRRLPGDDCDSRWPRRRSEPHQAQDGTDRR